MIWFAFDTCTQVMDASRPKKKKKKSSQKLDTAPSTATAV